MEIPPGHSKTADGLVELTFRVVGNRSWSMAVRSHQPPECYVGALSPDLETAEPALQLMGAHWKAVVALEQRRLTYQPALRLWQDMHMLRNTPLRLMYCLFESRGFGTDCSRGNRRSLERGKPGGKERAEMRLHDESRLPR